MNAELEEYIKRVDPGIHEAMGEIENFEEIVSAIRGDADEIMAKIQNDETFEHVAYLFAMQNRALNQLIEEVEELRPSIRFITSVLLGNAEQEATDG